METPNPPTNTTVVITGVPAIVGVSYAPIIGVAVTWQSLPASSGATGYQLQLYLAGQPVGTPTVVQGVSAFSGTIPGTLTNYQHFTVRICAIAAGVTGPLSPPQNVLVNAPARVSSSYDGTNALIEWEAVRDERVTGYSVTPSSNGTVGAALFTNDTSITLPVVANQTNTVQVQALSDVSTGPPTGQIGVITEKVTVSSVLYDGAHLSVSWSTAQTPGATYRVELYSGLELVSSYQSSATQATFAVVLDPAGTYTVAVRVLLPQQAGQLSATMNVIAAVPGILQVTGDAALVAIVLDTSRTSNAAGVEGYQAYLYQGEQQVAGPVTATSSGGVTSALMPFQLQAQYRYRVTVQAVGTTPANQAGPESAASAVIAEAPAGVSSSYDGTNALIEWEAVRDERVTGYAATMTSNGVTGASSYTSGTSITLAAAANQTNTVQVQALSDVSIGPPTGQLGIITEKVTVSSVLYDGAHLSVSWSAAQTTGATYRVELYSGLELLSSYHSSAAQATFAVNLDPAGAYTVAVRVLLPQQEGQLSTTMNVIAAVPGVLQVTGSAAMVSVILDTSKTSNAAGVEGYQAYLYQGEQQVAGPVTATSSGGVTSALMPFQLQTQYRYWVRVQAVGTAANQAGPESAAGAVIAETPAGVSSSYDGTNALIQWEALRDERVTSYAVVMTSNGVTGPTSYTNDTSITLAAANQTNTVQVQALSDVSIGPPTGQLGIITEKVTVSSVLYDGAHLSVSWSAAQTTGATYRVELYSGVELLSSYHSSAAQATFAVVLDPAGAYTVAVRVLLPQQEGQLSAAANIVTAPVVIQSAKADPITGKTTLQWVGVTGASFSLQLYLNGLPWGQPTTGLTGTSYLIPNTLPVGADVSAAISAVVTTSGTTASGPFGMRYSLPTTQPSNVSLDFNGVALLVKWTPAIGATGYTATVFVTNATEPPKSATATANANSVTFPPFTVHSSFIYQVVVQANVNADSGPPTTAIPLFTPALFIGSGTTTAPYIRPSSSLEFSTQDINLYLPDLGAGTPLQNLPITSPAQSFKLSANSQPDTQANYPYVLTIPSTSAAWTFDSNTIRSPLQTDYISFLTSVETNNAIPWGISILQQAISRAMPQTFQETLYYAYGLNLVNSYADLRPGMVLRVILNDYNNVGQGAPAAWLNGYIGGSSLDYDISSYLSPSLAPAQQWTVGFDAMLAQLAASGAISVSAPQSTLSTRSEAGVAEAIDLFYGSFRKPFYRLFFPSSVVSPTGVGTVSTPSNFVVAAAPSYSALAATVNFPTATNAVACFRGRTILKLCIRVYINEVEDLIPIGTTVGNILERYAQQIPSSAVAFSAIRLERSLGLAVTDPTLPVLANASYRVRLDWNHLIVYGPAHDALSLPLLHGDRLTIG
jgi:hypothetical protein